MKIVVTVEGGLVDAIFTDTDKEVIVMIVDRDTDFLDDDETVMVDDERVFINTFASTFSKSFVDRIFNLRK